MDMESLEKFLDCVYEQCRSNCVNGSFLMSAGLHSPNLCSCDPLLSPQGPHPPSLHTPP